MGEIKMNDADLREIASALRYLEGHEDADRAKRIMWGQIAGSIEEQVKPAVEEPTEFGSIMLAHFVNGKALRWVRLPDSWVSELGGFTAPGANFKIVEVLRVGIGADAVAPEGFDHAAYTMGVERAGAVHLLRLRDLRASANSAERKDAYDKAIRAVEEPLP